LVNDGDAVMIVEFTPIKPMKLFGPIPPVCQLPSGKTFSVPAHLFTTR